jgi:peptidoglycan biosynthesis protein MviN/MurJ (putative lipid II flippase)
MHTSTRVGKLARMWHGQTNAQRYFSVAALTSIPMNVSKIVASYFQTQSKHHVS